MTDIASARHDDAVPSIGDVIAQKYRVESVVGIGGMGVVVAARHLQLGQTVAIKLLSAPDEERRAEASSRFMREAQAAAALRNDHVVRIYDVGTLDTGLPFMVMELLQGSDLGALIDADGPFPVPQAVDFLLQACAAIAEAHAAGIVHRDLKPSNLFVTRRTDGTPLLKVLDFGISKTLSKGDSERGVVTLTSTRTVMGSPYYMSPEQVRDARKVDGRSDVWSLGVILHELLTGEPAFQADTFPGVCAAIIADPPRTVRATRPDVPEALERIVLTCLEKDVSRRYQSVSELAKALLPFASEALAVSGSKMWSQAEPGPLVANAESAVVRSARSSPGFDETVASPRAPGKHRTPSGDTKTQLSADLLEPSSKPRPAVQSRSRAWTFVGGTVVVIGGALGAASFLREPAQERAPVSPPSAAPVAAAARPFTLTIDSTPPSAEVYEGSERVGQTPVTLTYPASDRKIRSFVLRKPGYQAHTLEQAPLEGDLRVHAALVAEAPEPAASTGMSAAVAAPKPARGPTRQPAPRSKPSATSAPPADIRLQR